MLAYKTELMKKIVLIALAVISSLYGYSQQLTATQLLEMAGCIHYACLSERAEATGYKVTFNEENDAYKTYRFASEQMYQNESNPGVAMPNRLEMTLIKADYSITLNYLTGSDNERDRLLQQFKEEGFVYVKATKSMSTADNVATMYASEKYPKVQLRVTNYSRQRGEGREVVDEKSRYMDYGFELQWLFVPPPSERNK